MTRWALEAGRRGLLDDEVLQARHSSGSFFTALALFHAGAMYEFVAEWKRQDGNMTKVGFIIREVEQRCYEKGSKVVQQAKATLGHKYQLV